MISEQGARATAIGDCDSTVLRSGDMPECAETLRFLSYQPVPTPSKARERYNHRKSPCCVLRLQRTARGQDSGFPKCSRPANILDLAHNLGADGTVKPSAGTAMGATIGRPICPRDQLKKRLQGVGIAFRNC